MKKLPLEAENLPAVENRVLASTNVGQSNKKDLNQNLSATLRTIIFELVKGVFGAAKIVAFSPKIQKSLVFPIPKSFLTQIFFIGPETH